jgi:hypothetical protein
MRSFSYPIVYSVLVLPLSVVRWSEFVPEMHGRMSHVPPAATFAVISIYALSGAANVLLYYITRASTFNEPQHTDTPCDLGRLPRPSDLLPDQQ